MSAISNSKATKNKAPKKRDSAATRERIMQAGMAEFGVKGFDGARTEDIAKKSKCNIRMLYHYYGGKKNLYLACLERVYSNIREQEEKLNLLEMEPQEAIEQLVRFTFNHMHKNPDFVNMVGVENTQRGKFIKQLPQLANAADSLINTIKEVLERGEKNGVFREDIDAFQLYISILSLGYLHLSNRFTLSLTYNRNLDSEEWLSDRLEHVLDLVLSYVKVRKED